MASAQTAGQPIKCLAAVARGPKQDLSIEEVTVAAPKVLPGFFCNTANSCLLF
jgi:hypothetical protein